MSTLTVTQSRLAHRIYLVLAALFICSLVVSNLIFQKFFIWNPWGLFEFKLSVGLLPYPITFLITDLVSEVYGKRKANDLVLAGIFASVFSLLIIYVAAAATPATSSPLDGDTFNLVFGNSFIAVLASMSAYLFAQFIDIRIYHFWKKLTNGKMLWLRNNFSTVFSQFIDTLCILLLLCSTGLIPWNLFKELLVAGVLFKMLVAFLDTPLLYAGVHLLNKIFHLKSGEELQLD